jgi:hypothetical protein
MFYIPERNFVAIRLALLSGWLALIGSLLMPISLGVSGAGAIVREALGQHCVQVQVRCVLIQPQANVATLFWGAIVPAAIVILLVFGHVTWRRICPLSMVSQIPRLLGWQRLDARGKPLTITSDSWMGRYHSYVQFAFLFIGLCLRLLILNADSIWLGLWFLLTIAFAMAIGFLYAGKSWCHYFCPMAPVQQFFAMPMGLFTRKAHVPTQIIPQSIPQSMCRRSQSGATSGVKADRSVCSVCTTHCMDIDAELTYWETIDRPETKWLYYGYVGLVLGFFGSFYLYAGNWEYYFSGVWSRESTLFTDLWQSGLYFLPNNIYIPKILAIPMALMFTVLSTYAIGMRVEKYYFAWQRSRYLNINPIILTHRLYTFWTVITFNLFFLFAGRPFLFQLPDFWRGLGHGGLTLGVLMVSALWTLRVWRRSPDRYAQEQLASRWFKQLHRQNLDLKAWLDGRSIYALDGEELDLLRKTIPVRNPGQREPIDRALLQSLLNEVDQSFRGRWRHYRHDLLRRGWIVLASQHLSRYFPQSISQNLPQNLRPAPPAIAASATTRRSIQSNSGKLPPPRPILGELRLRAYE